MVENDKWDELYKEESQLQLLSKDVLIEYITNLKKMIGKSYFCFSCDEIHYDFDSTQCDLCFRPYCSETYMYSCNSCIRKICFECYETCPISGCHNRICKQCIIEENYENIQFFGCKIFYCSHQHNYNCDCTTKKIYFHCVFSIVDWGKCGQLSINNHICTEHYSNLDELIQFPLKDRLPQELLEMCIQYFYKRDDIQMKKKPTFF